MRLLTLLILLLVTLDAFAQTYEVADGQTQSIRISAREINRIRVDGGRIENVRGPAGRMTLETDESRGEVYLRAATEAPFSIYVSADNGETYTLLLTPAQIPAVTISLRPASGASALPLADADTSDPYLVRIKNLIRVMQSDNGRYHQVPLNQPVNLGGSLQVIREKRWPAAPGQLVGEVWRVTNASPEPVVLRERTFIQMQQLESVLALAIEDHVLNPAETTRVLIVSKEVVQ